MIEGPVKTRRIKRSTRRLLIIGAVVVAAALAALMLGTRVYSGYVDRLAEERRTERQAQAGQAARQVSAAFQRPRTVLQTMADDAAVHAALAAHDAGALAELTARYQNQLPGALRLRVFEPDSAAVDNVASPPLTYASLDMIGQAQRSADTVAAEVHLHGSENAHIVIVQRVPASADDLAGILHLSLNVGSLSETAAQIHIPGTYVEIRQLVRGSPPLVLARAGNPAADDEAAIVGIDGTRWAVALRDASAVSLSGGNGQLLLIAGLAAAVVILIVALTGAVRRRGGTAVASGEADYQGAIRAIMDGSLAGLDQYLPEPGGGRKVRPAAEAATSPVAKASSKVVEQPADLPPAIDITAAFEPQPAGIEVVETTEEELTQAIPASIFRNYDIRGIVGETLTEQGVYQIGQAIGTLAGEKKQQTVVVARDGRHSSKSLQESLIAGLRATGRNVLDIGLTPTPVLYFATHYLDARSGVMVTGSHNPGHYNGLKMVLDGETLSGEAIQAVRKCVESQQFATGQGELQSAEIIPDYIRRISEEIPVTLGNAMTVVVDCGNGVPGIVAPHILRAIGHDVIELYCEVDGDFPNHHPDPAQPANLADLIETVQNEDADLGLAFDGDGDRLGVVDAEGNIIWPDRQMMLFARDVIARNPGAQIIYDVKCSGRLTTVIKEAGGDPLMWKTGHSLLKAKMKETGALLAGEMSGHIFFKERWYGFDDALYAAARLLEILVKDGRPPVEIFAELPDGVSTPELKLDMPEEQHAPFMTKVMAAANFENATILDIDGLRVDFADGWGLIRPSNTTPCLVMRFEGDDDAALKRVQDAFRDLLLGVDSSLSLPF